MNKYIKLFFLLIAIFGVFFNVTKANINLMISPIIYEVEGEKGTIVYKTAQLYNRTDKTLTIYTGKSDFESRDNTGNPYFINTKESELTGQELSSWLEIDSEGFEILPKETKIINFSINIPEDATPGGHYGAVSFKNKNTNSAPGNKVGIDVDYKILILVSIEGEIIKKANFGSITIKNHNKALLAGEDECIFGFDLTGDDYDNKCIDLSIENLKNSIFDIDVNKKSENTVTYIPEYLENKNNGDNLVDNSGDNNQQENEIVNNTKGDTQVESNDTNKVVDKNGSPDTKPDEKGDEIKDGNDFFKVTFDIPIENEGNTHIKPEGKITLIDEDGKIIKGIGREIIKSKNGVIIGEKIVDYIPINDVGGNILPYSERDFNLEWNGFPYKDYDDEGNQVIKYWTPEEYYSKQNIESRKFLMPWEMIKERNNEKNIKAVFNIKYQDVEGEDVVYSSAKDFGVSYKEQYIAINYLFLIFIGFILLIIIFILFIILKMGHRCKYCDKKIKKKMKICPYCGKPQKGKTIIKTTKKKSKSKIKPKIKVKSSTKPKVKAKKTTTKNKKKKS